MDETGSGTTIQQGQNIFNIGSINEANFGSLADNKPYNEYLTKELLTAIKPYCPMAAKYLELVKNKPDWNQLADLSNKAKEILSANFVGVIGIQLRKLMAIGKENGSDTKLHNYIDNCLVTAKRTVQLLCFALISDLWNKKKETNYPISGEQTETLNHFFEDWMELSLKDYVGLLNCLYSIYKDNNIQLPLSELAELNNLLLPGSNFLNACDKLQAISETPDTEKYKSKNCDEVEIQLTNLLSALSFLSAYKMVSIKSIGYEEIRNSSPQYLHNYVALGFDSKANINIEKLNYINEPIDTDSILLYKGNYMNGINLFPFIIDLNALTFEGGVKVCFFSAMDMDENSMNYCFLEDNSIESIAFSDIKKSGGDINDLMEDKEKRKKLKLDSVFTEFREAKKTILG